MITSAPLALTVAGKSYEFYPLTFEDFEWLELKLRARFIEAGRMGGADLEQVLQLAQKIDIFDELDSLQSPIVLVWMMQRMLRHAEPAVLRSSIEAWIVDVETQKYLMPHIISLCGLGTTGKNPTPAGTP